MSESNGKPKLRLLKVIVQPVFVIDDGKTLLERPADPVSVVASDWPGYPAEFLKRFEELRASVED